MAQYAGSDMAMKQQLVRMVHMMNKLNNVSRLRNKTFHIKLCSELYCATLCLLVGKSMRDPSLAASGVSLTKVGET